MKNLRTILLLFFANTISSIAQGISMIAIPWYFIKMGESRMLFLVYLLITFTSMFWGPVAGTWIDKYNRKTIFLALTTICGTALFAAAGYGFYQGSTPLWLAGTVFLLTFLNYNVHYPNLYAFVQEIIEKQHYAKITSYMEVQNQVSVMLAGFAAAMLLEGAPDGLIKLGGMNILLPFEIPAWELHQIFLLDASTYIVAFVLIATMKYVPLVIRKVETGNLITRFQKGIQYLKDHPRIFIFGIASYMVFATLLVNSFAVVALYVEAHLQETGDVFGFGKLCYAFGALLAGMFVHLVFKRVSTVNAIIFLTLLAGAYFLTLATNSSVLLFYVMGIVIGFANAGVRVLRVTYLFKYVPNQVYGRASGVFYIVNVLYRLFFLGLFLLPFFHTSNNVVYAMMIFTVCLVLAALVLWWNKRQEFVKSDRINLSKIKK